MKKLVALAVALLCGLCVCFVSCNYDADEDVWLFYATYNEDGTLGSAGLTQSEWEEKLSSVSNGSKIVLPAELSSDDLKTFAAALIASGKTDITLDLSNLSITSIAAETFSGCTALTAIVLPETIVSIGENAFSGCTSLTLVTYEGTTDDWDSISIASGNGYLTGATIVCSDGSTESVTVSYTGSSSALGAVVAIVKVNEITDVVVTQSSGTFYCTESATDSDGVSVWYYQDGGTIYTLEITASGSSYTYDYSTQVISGTFEATLDGGGTALGTVTVVVKDGVITSVKVGSTSCDAQTDGTFSYSDDDYTYAITISGSNGVFTYTYEVTDGTLTATLDGEGTELGTVTVVLKDGAVTAVSVGGTSCTAQADGTYSYSDDEYAYAITISGSNGVYTYTYDITGGTSTATLDGDGIALGTVKVVLEDGEVTSVTVNGTSCDAQDDGIYSYSDDEYTYAITISSSNGVFYYTYDITDGTVEATLGGSGTALGTVTVVLEDGEVTAVSVGNTSCTAQTDGTFTYTGSDYTYAIAISGSNGVYTYTYEITGGTFEATLDGSDTELGTVTVILEDGAITSVTVDSTECDAQDDGTFSYTSEGFSYAITISGSNGVYTYTYEPISDIFTASYSGSDTELGAAVTVVVTDGAVTAVSVGDTACDAQDDGTFTYASGADVYTITVSESDGSYSYSYDVSEGGNFFGSSDTSYTDFQTLLSSLSDGCTIVLYSDLTTAQFEYFVTALMKTSLSDVTVDMSYTSITEISSKTFYECSNITSVILPSSVETIGRQAFCQCTNLTSVTIAEGTTSIGDYAFASCSSLTEVTIPDSVTSLGSYAFSNCSALKTAVIGDDVETIGTYAFYKCTNLTSVTIGENVTTIGSYAFEYCSSLTEVTIPDSVTSLGTYAFYYCTKLESAVIGEGVTTIPSYAFYYCTALEIVKIGSNVTKISANSSTNYNTGGAFGYCSALETVVYNGTKSDWESITITASSYTAGNYYLTNATISCTDGIY